jgi:hypothetical protein
MTEVFASISSAKFEIIDILGSPKYGFALIVGNVGCVYVMEGWGSVPTVGSCMDAPGSSAS